MTEKNLWPDFDLSKGPRSPKSVIESAGKGLEEKTKGTVHFYSRGATINKDSVVASFALMVPALSYMFPFLQAKFAVSVPYPVTVVAHQREDVVAKDETELIAALASIFNAPSTIEAINRLASLAK